MSTTRARADDDLMALVRRADPLEGGAEPLTDDAAESLLRELLASPRAQPRPMPWPKRVLAVRLSALATAGALVFGAAIALPGSDRGGVGPASAAVLRQAGAALAQGPGTILHVDVRGTQTTPDGSTVHWRDESWQQNAAPSHRRQVETDPDGTVVESASAGDREQLYDPGTDTIYTSTPRPAPPRFWLSPGPTPKTYVVRTPVFRKTAGHRFEVVPGGPTLVITAREAEALKDGTDVVKWRRTPARGAHTRARFQLVVVPAAATRRPPSCAADPDSRDFRRQMLTLLRFCGARLVGHATVAGRDTLEIRFRGHTTYYVDPASYVPVELDTAGTGGRTSLRFLAYEALPADRANRALLSLTAQHPSAEVDRDRAHYEAAEQRLFPHG